jgi:hypothetical protein
MTANQFGVVFMVAAFAFALLIYLVFLQWRRARFKKLAEALGAIYQYQGFAATGEILGNESGRKYTVITKAAGRSGMWTVVSAECANRGIGMTIFGGFFKHFPNWRFVYVHGDGTSAGPGTKITLLDIGHPIDERYKIPVQNLLQEVSLMSGAVLKKGDLKVDQNSISFTKHYVLTNAETMRQIVSGITQIARRVESDPVV